MLTIHDGCAGLQAEGAELSRTPRPEARGPHGPVGRQRTWRRGHTVTADAPGPLPAPTGPSPAFPLTPCGPEPPLASPSSVPFLILLLRGLGLEFQVVGGEMPQARRPNRTDPSVPHTHTLPTAIGMQAAPLRSRPGAPPAGTPLEQPWEWSSL